MSAYPAFLDALPETPDLRDEGQEDEICVAADRLVATQISSRALRDTERVALQRSETSLAAHLTIKLAISRALLLEYKPNGTLAVVFAVYRETGRLQTTGASQVGEDLLRRKCEQLAWLCRGSELKWHIQVVDDGCPDGSGKLAQQIVGRDNLEDCVSVAFLDDAITEGLELFAGITDTSQSQKGGAIQYGLWLQRKADYVLYTDADLSTHLGQTGRLLAPLMNHNSGFAAGSRRDHASRILKSGARSDRGKLFIYLWKQMLGDLDGVLDTQCAFKAISGSIIDKLLPELKEHKFAFDIELMLRYKQLDERPIATSPLVWIDSEAASTTVDLAPYLGMLKSIAGMAQRYRCVGAGGTDLAKFVESLSEDQWERLLTDIPQEIMNGNLAEFADSALVSVQDLERILSMI